MYCLLPVLSTTPVNVQVTLPVFVSELLTRKTDAVQSVALVARATKVNVAFRMPPGYGSQTGSPVPASMCCIRARSVIGPVDPVFAIAHHILPAYATRAAA